MQVYKFKIPVGGGTLPLPYESNILKVGVQGEDICMWAEVDPSIEKIEARVFFVTGTGHEIPEFEGCVRQFIDTVFMGDLVWHVYELVAQ